MKKFFSLILALLMVVSLGANLTACAFLGSDFDTTPKTQTIAVYQDETSESYSVTFGKMAEIEIPSKQDYYFIGAYDAMEGGMKYFDEEGKSLLAWEETFPTTFYVRWGDISELKCTLNVFDNEPKSGGSSGQRTAKAVLDTEFISALKGNFDKQLKIEYSIDLKTGAGYETASPIGLYLKGYDNSGADRHTIFTHTPIVGEFSTFTGMTEIDANDFVNGNIYVVLWNTKKYMGAWAYPVYYSRNFTMIISFA